MKIIPLLLAALLIPMGLSARYQAKEENGRYGIVDENGKWILAPVYSYVSAQYAPKTDNIIGFYVHQNNKHGFADPNGKIVVPLKFDQAFLYYGTINKNSDPEYFVFVETGGKKGAYSTDGKQIFAPAYDLISSDGYGWVIEKGGKQGYAAPDGKIMVECKYPGIYKLDKYFTTFDKEQNFYGAVNFQGKELVPLSACVISYNNDSGTLTAEFASGDATLIDLDGNTIIPKGKYVKIKRAADDLWTMQDSKGKWGLHGREGVVVTCQYDKELKFSNDVATAEKAGEVTLMKNPLKDGSNILIAGGDAKSNKGVKLRAESRYPAPDSDVDTNIPKAKSRADNTFAFIIANENYDDAPVPYALNDGRMFRQYLAEAYGLPEKNINMYEDATYGSIIAAVDKMKEVAKAYEGDASVIFYYAGHGFPDDKSSTAYLLPVDGNASDITVTGYPLSKLYKEIAELPLRKAVVLLDACFSGAVREDKMLAQSRGVAIKVRDEAPAGNMVVFTASQGDETAHQLEDKHHGLFTYYLLKGIRENGPTVDLGTLTGYVTKQVKRQSVVINNKKQTPSVNVSGAMADSWQSLPLADSK